MVSRWTGGAAVVALLVVMAAGCGQAAQQTGALPQGMGLAAKYPEDRGIGRDPSVLLAEDFETGDLADLSKRWSDVSNREGKVLAFSEDVPPGSGGKRSLQVTATAGQNTGGHLYSRLSRGVERVFARFYVKFAADADYVHHFVHLGGYNPSTSYPQGGAGERPRGDERVTVGIEPYGDYGRNRAPGAWNFYAYWQEMKGSADGRFWGNGIQPEQPLLTPRDRWQCVEVMMKLNSTPEKADGELALWLDGDLAMAVGPGTPRGPWTGMGFRVLPRGGEPFEGFRWRSSRDLKINFFWLLHYVTENAARQNRVEQPRATNRVWFDNIVVSTEYVGPLQRRRPVTSRALGPLRVHPSNPRYFADPSGRAVYLTGSHTWSNLQDMGTEDPPKPFDFEGYLDLLERHHHNLIRLWRWEQPRWKEQSGEVHYCAPHPWQRAGPGQAQDGKPRFDLTRYDPAYFQRLRQRVTAARDRGIYVSVMLFEGWGMQFAGDGWRFHPFHPANNVNQLTGGGKDGLGIYTLADQKVTALQEAYVRKVIDAVGDLDNVLYEISNENHPGSTDWQAHMVRFIKQVESAKGRRHPVGMTFQYQGGSNATLFASPADWVSPNPEGGYREDPPAADGRKVVLLDTDHLWGEGGDYQWVWKSFLRGHNPLYMDRVAALTGNPEGDIAGAEESRRALGETRRMAERVNLSALVPHPELASTAYCLADPSREYLVYLPAGGTVTVDLSAATGTLRVEWTHPVEGTRTGTGTTTGGGKRTLTAPGSGAAVLLLRSGSGTGASDGQG